MSGSLPTISTGLPATLEDVERFEYQVAQAVTTVDDLAELQEWHAKFEALEHYWKSRELHGPMLGAQRRVEARIGQLLGEPQVGRPKENSPCVGDFSRHHNDRTDFRILARGFGKLSDDEWRQSRSKLVALIRQKFPPEPRSPAHVERIRELASAGEITKAIAAALGIGTGRVSAIARRHGIKVRDPRPKQAARVDEVVKRAKAGDSPQEIARALGLSEAYVRDLALKDGARLFKPKRSARRERNIADIRRLAEQGFRASQIAATLSLNIKHVRRVARESSIVLPDRYIGKSRGLDALRIIGTTVDMVATYAQDVQTHGDLNISNITTEQALAWCASLDLSIKYLRRLRSQINDAQTQMGIGTAGHRARKNESIGGRTA
jgi:hypothetical protein